MNEITCSDGINDKILSDFQGAFKGEAQLGLNVLRYVKGSLGKSYEEGLDLGFMNVR